MKTKLILLAMLLLGLGGVAIAQGWILLEVVGYESYPGQVVVQIKPAQSQKQQVDCIARIRLEFQGKEITAVDSAAFLKPEELNINAAKLLAQCQRDSANITSFREFFDAAKRWEIQPIVNR